MASGKEARSKATNLLDPKVLQNVGIALAKFRLPPRDIRDAILAMDERVLSLDLVKSLHSLRPTAEDASTLGNFEGDRSTLGKVERFFLLVMEIPRYVERLECLMFKLRFSKEMEDLQKELEVIRAATTEVKSSKKLARILEVVLKLGNFLNGGTTRGGLYGFRLDTLPKLATIKSVDNKRTLMNFLAEYCAVKEPTLLDVAVELKVAGSTARRHPLKAVATTLRGVQEKVGLVAAQVDLAKAARGYETDDEDDADDDDDEAAEAEAEAEADRRRALVLGGGAAAGAIAAEPPNNHHPPPRVASASSVVGEGDGEAARGKEKKKVSGRPRVLKRDPNGDRFVEAMDAFHMGAKRRVERMELEFEAVEKGFRAMLQRFGEDPDAMGCEEFFGEILEEFLKLLHKAHQQNEKQRQLEEKATKRAEAARKKKAAKEARAKVRKGIQSEVDSHAFSAFLRSPPLVLHSSRAS